MKTKNLILIIVVAIMMAITGCSKEQTIVVKWTWEDNDNFELTENWNVALYEDAHGIINDEIYNSGAIDIKPVTAGTTTEESFTYDGKALTWTAVVYNDANGNGTFDAEDYNYAYDFGDEEIVISKVMY